MARWWRHTLIAIAGLAAAFPLRIQLDLSHGSGMPLFDGSALAKGSNGGGGNGNGGGHGGGSGGGNGNSDGGGRGGGNGNAGGNGTGSGNAGGGNSDGSAGSGGNSNSGGNGKSDGGGRGGGPGGPGNGGGNGNSGGNASSGGKGGGGNAGNQGNAGSNANGGGNGGGRSSGAGNGNSAGNGNGGGKSNDAASGGARNGNSNAGGLGGVGGSRGAGGGNGNGSGLGRGNGASSSAGGNVGRGNSAGVGGNAGAGKGNSNASGNSGNASRAASTGARPSSSKSNPKASAPSAANATSGQSQRVNDKAQASTGKASASPSKAAASTAQPSSRAKAAAPVQAAKTAPAVTAQPIRAMPVVEEIDRRPKPRQASRSIVTSGLSRTDLARLTAQGFRIESGTQGNIAPQVFRLRVPSGISVARAKQRVRLLDAQASVDFDQFYYLDESTSACMGAECLSNSLVDWTSLVKRSGLNPAQCGPAPLIGVIDTGINVEHDALKGQAIEVVAQSTRRAMPSLQNHGTAIAALLVGRPGSQTPGLLPDARLVAVDAFYRDGGTADRTDVTSLVKAIEALAERGVRVINMSLSGPANEVLQKAIAAAQAKGIVIVAAAGNNGPGAEPSYPAGYPGVLAVTAVDHKLHVYRRATQGPYVDLSAPGVNVWTASAQGSGRLRTGTSYAVPFVSAAAGMLLASDPTLYATDLQTRLEAHTRDLGKPGRDPTYGFGLIQMVGLCERPADAPAIATVSDQSTAPPDMGQTLDIP